MDMMTRPARVGDGDVKHFMGVASYNVINIMVRWLLEKHQADHMVTTKYGFKLNRVIGPGWIMDLGRSECFEDDDEYSTWLMISNLKYVRLHAYRDLALKVHRMIQGPAKDGHHQENDQWTSTETISHRMPESGLIVKNITS
jgi:hypothetical protein